MLVLYLMVSTIPRCVTTTLRCPMYLFVSTVPRCVHNTSLCPLYLIVSTIHLCPLYLIVSTIPHCVHYTDFVSIIPTLCPRYILVSTISHYVHYTFFCPMYLFVSTEHTLLWPLPVSPQDPLRAPCSRSQAPPARRGTNACNIGS